jgi:hypothetical protein
MSRATPAADCGEIALTMDRSLEPPAQVALEDYARVLTRARAAEVVTHDDGRVRGVHLCGLPGNITPEVERDVADFARELTSEPRGGLGWS